MYRYALIGLWVIGLLACRSPQPAAPEKFAISNLGQALLAREVSARGERLYLYDRAAWLASDVLLADLHTAAEDPDFPAPSPERLAGYLPLRDGEQWRVIFYSQDPHPVTLYEVRVWLPEERTERVPVDGRTPVSDEELRMIRARETAVHATAPHTQKLNPVVIAGKEFGSAGWIVYLLAATTKPNLAVLGMHYRVDISEDGALRTIEPLSDDVLELPTQHHGKPYSLSFQYKRATIPNEVHVMTSLVHKRTLAIKTDTGVWVVAGTSLAFAPKRPHGLF